MAAWMTVNGEAIFETRPWLCTARAATARGGHFKEDFAFSAGHPVHAVEGRQDRLCHRAGRAEGTVRITSLSGEKITAVTLLGSDAKLDWRQDANAVVIQPIESWPCFVVAFKVALAK